MPLRNSYVIHPKFQHHHEPTIIKTHTVSALLKRPDLTGSRALGDKKTTYAPPVMLWAGMVRIESNYQVGEAKDSAGRIIRVGRYLVTATKEMWDVAKPRIGDVVDIIKDPDNPALNGLSLQVVDTSLASLEFEYALGCDVQQASNRGA